MQATKDSILWKLLAINIFVVLGVILVLWLTIDYLAADYFSLLMTRYKISPAETHAMFLDSIHRYLIQASLAAIALSVGLSFLLTRKLLRPLSNMAAVTRQVAAGDYSARVDLKSDDEVGQLGRAFDNMADSLERTERLRKNMVADASHELRTPLTNVRGYLEGLADGVVAPSKETFDMLLREILRLVRLVEDLNQLAKAEGAGLQLHKQPVFLPDLVEDLLALERPSFNERGLILETRFAEGCGEVEGDPDKLAQVIRNILQNAWRYAEEGGRVTVAAERQGASVTLSVTNRGEGIDAQDLPLIFERFYRADKSRSRDSGGSGIGLTIAKQLVEAQGGSVGASSEGGLTRVWFSLPVMAGSHTYNV